MNARSLTAGLVYYTGKFFANLVTMHKYEAVGTDAIPKREPFVIMASHDSSMNIIEDGNLTTRRLSFLSKSENYNNPVFSLLQRLGGQIRFDRSGANMDEVYSGLEHAVIDNIGIVIYPEGTRNTAPIIGKAGRRVIDIVGHVVELSSRHHARIYFVALGRTVDGSGYTTVTCEQKAYAENGQIVIPEGNAKLEYEMQKPEGKGLEFFVNGHIMPTLARLSHKTYNPSVSAIMIGMLSKRGTRHLPKKPDPGKSPTRNN